MCFSTQPTTLLGGGFAFSNVSGDGDADNWEEDRGGDYDDNDDDGDSDGDFDCGGDMQAFTIIAPSRR